MQLLIRFGLNVAAVLPLVLTGFAQRYHGKNQPLHALLIDPSAIFAAIMLSANGLIDLSSYHWDQQTLGSVELLHQKVQFPGWLRWSASVAGSLLTFTIAILLILLGFISGSEPAPGIIGDMEVFVLVVGLIALVLTMVIQCWTHVLRERLLDRIKRYLAAQRS